MDGWMGGRLPAVQQAQARLNDNPPTPVSEAMRDKEPQHDGGVDDHGHLVLVQAQLEAAHVHANIP